VKSSIANAAISFVLVATVLCGAVNPVLANSSAIFSQTQFEENGVRFKYPYSGISADERTRLAQNEIDILSEQLINFQPGQGTTLSYLINALSREKVLVQSIPQPDPAQTTNSVSYNKVNKPVAVNMIYYGSNGNGIDRRIINTTPEYLVDNSPAGPANGDANIVEYKSVGIKYFEYLDGGYEGTQSRFIPNDLQSNLNYITAVANAGAYGIFLDEVSSNPNSESMDYLKQIYQKAHSLGLKVVFNTGVSIWSDNLMKYCDFMNSSEIWHNEPLTRSQRKFAKKTWLETQEVTGADAAVKLTEGAWNAGLGAHFACYEYISLPDYLESYTAQIRLYSRPNTSLIMVIITLTAFVLVVVVFVWRKRLRK